MLPSASLIVAPLPLSMKIGALPTAFHARTGEFTAPGILTLARLKSSSDFFLDVIADFCTELSKSKIFFRSRENFCCARRYRDDLCPAARKIVIARDGFQSRFARSRDRSKNSRAHRAIARARNFLYDSHASREIFFRACPLHEISLSRSLGRTLRTYKNHLLLNGSFRGARAMASKRVYITCLDQVFKAQQNRSKPGQVDSPACGAIKLLVVTMEIPLIHRCG